MIGNPSSLFLARDLYSEPVIKMSEAHHEEVQIDACDCVRGGGFDGASWRCGYGKKLG